MNNPKAQFQINNGAGWQTIAEADIIDGVAQAPDAWTMVRAMQKRIHYTGYTQEKIIVSPDPRDTHFLGFAEAIQKELASHLAEYDPNGCILSEITRDTIARRAYDLVMHTLWHTIPASGSSIKKYAGLTIEEIANAIPDMPELPEVEE